MPTKAEHLSRVERYRNRAEEVRAVAYAMHDPECRSTLLRLAVSYEVMAETAAHAAERPNLESR